LLRSFSVVSTLFGQSFDVISAAASTLPTTVLIGLVYRGALT